MPDHIFLLDESELTRQEALGLVSVLYPSNEKKSFKLFTKRKKISFTSMSARSLRRLIFVGPVGQESLGEFSFAEWVRALALSIDPPCDRALVQDLYLIHTGSEYVPAEQMLKLANLLASYSFVKLRLHALDYAQTPQAEVVTALDSEEAIFLPGERLEDMEKRVDVARRKTITSFIQKAQTQSVALQHELHELRKRAQTSCFAFFIRFEIATKEKKLQCLEDLKTASDLADLKERARVWSNDRRACWSWRNTVSRTWFESRTGKILEDINKIGEAEEKKVVGLDCKN